VSLERVRLAQALSLVALVAALVGALGPAERERTVYSWPPRALPAGTPERLWYAPLPLSRHRPEALTARVPCVLPRRLRPSARRVTVLATARSPERANALAILREGDALAISVGGRPLARVPLPLVDTDQGCAYEVRVEGNRWAVEGGPENAALGGELEAMPVVFGFFSALDLRSRSAPTIAVRTGIHIVRPVVRQALAWTIAVLAIAAALGLVAFQRRPRPLAALGRWFRAARAHANPVDALVVLGLVGWWVISPAFFDDGWIYAKLNAFDSHGFSSYYVFLGTNAPLGYWLDWLQRWLAESTTAVLLLRLPAVLCVAALWVLCRAVLARVLPSSARGGVVALWTLASVFLVGTFAWGMTLRPEPLAALLVTGALLCAIAFLERRTAGPLAVAAILAPLAVTAHPSGVVALAPLLAVAPALLRFAREHAPAATTMAASAIALSLVLLFLGADLEQRRVDTQTISALDTATDSWFDEASRYELLSVAPYGTPLRRALVALVALTLVAFALRARRRLPGPAALPTLTLALGLLLLVPTPSKWPSHFGTFIGLLAIAGAVEMAALRERRSRAFAPYVLLGAAAIAGVWSWAFRGAWNPVDLRTHDWRPPFESWIPLPALSAILPLLALVAAVMMARRRARPLPEAPWRAASWSAGLFGVPLLVFTFAVVALDTTRTNGWTHAAQSIEALAGGADCGLAEDLRVPPRSGEGEPEPLARRLERDDSSSLVLPSLVTYFPCARLPELGMGVVETPDTIVSYPNELSPIRYPLTSPFVGILDLYRLRELPIEPTNTRADGQVLVYEVDRTIPGALLAPVTGSGFTS